MNLFLPPTSTEWVLFCCIFFGLGLFILTAEYIRTRLHGSPEITRKMVHILTGVLVCFAPNLFTSGIPPMLLAAAFMLINYFAIRTGVLKGMHGTNRRSFGTVYYPFSFFVLVLLAWGSSSYIITISMLVLALADAAAAIVGENIPSPHTYFLTSDKKSIEGSAAMFAVTFIVIYGGLIVFLPPTLTLPIPAALVALAVSCFVTAWESISSQGTDNLTIPLSAGFVLDYIITPLPHHDPWQFIIGLGLACAIAAVSYRLKFLSADGAVATFLLASVIFGIGGWMWTVPIVVFFVASSLLSRLGGVQKQEAESLYAKSNRRDAGQVAANGGLAGALIVLWYMFPDMNFVYAGYVGAIAAVTSDTWGTEIGTMLSRRPRSISTFKIVPPGTSGGVSLPGIAAGAAGAMLIGISAAVLFRETAHLKTLVAAAVVAGLAGTLIDSLLGATVQARYRCGSCGKETERASHCGGASSHVSGEAWITNDIVNWACASAGAAAAILWLMA